MTSKRSIQYAESDTACWGFSSAAQLVSRAALQPMKKVLSGTRTWPRSLWTHAPDAQTSPPTPQPLPSTTGLCAQVPDAVMQASVVHGLSSSQSRALPATHLPALQASSTVQPVPS